MAPDLLRSQPHIGLAAGRRVREHLAQGGDMEGARKIVLVEPEKSGLFSVDIGGQAVTPGELAERAKEALARVGQDASEPLRSEPLPGVESPPDPGDAEQAVRCEIERAEGRRSAHPRQRTGDDPAGDPARRVAGRAGGHAARGGGVP